MNGEEGPYRDVVLLNCGISLYAFDRVPSIAEGIELARNSIDDGHALNRLKELVRISNQ